MNELKKLWSEIEDDLGFNDHNMSRHRPYDGQPHTQVGTRGATEIRGLTFRDLRDCFVRAVCLSGGVDTPLAEALYKQACKGEHAALCENDIYKIWGTLDGMAVLKNLCCEIERVMGIFPNVPQLTAIDDAPET